MVKVYVGGVRHELKAGDVVGKGGEADIYRYSPNLVLKRYKEASDPDYTGNVLAQHGATIRMQEQQRKLLAFPSGLPANVVAPVDLAYDQVSSGQIVGYTMRYLQDMEVLLRFGDRQYREQGGIDGNRVIDIFRNLHGLVQGVHKAGVVIGDFNDLNVLVDKQDQTYLVDADSMQFGGFLCQAYANRFVDPLVCESTLLTPRRPHNEESDWYAYLVMLCQSLLYAGPYAGVHRPKAGQRLQHDARVLRRLTVFNPDVLYPKPALPLSILPDDMLQYLHEVFEQDKRHEFPLQLLGTMRWTTCKNCAVLHARATCPQCVTPGAVKQTVAVRGTVTATRIFRTPGRIVHAAYQTGKLRYLYYENGAFRREGNTVVLSGDLDPGLRFRVSGDTTLLAKRDKLFVLQPGDAPQRQTTGMFRTLPMFDANDRHYFWLQGDQLVRDGRYGSQFVGTVLAGQTLFWTGKHMGFGLYRAGQLMRSFVFNTEGQGLNDQVAIPNLPGQLVDATCAFSDTYAWFMASTQESGQLVNRCYVVDASGQVLAEATATQGDNSWLASGIRGHLAAGSSLYVATDDGVVRVGLGNGTVTVERTFPDTEPFVDSHTRLVPSPEGLYAISNQEIVLLKIR